MSWSELTRWWHAEIRSDSSYEEVVSPLLTDVLRPTPGGRYVDLGSGEGRVARMLRASGCDVLLLEANEGLAATSVPEPIVGDALAAPFRGGSFDGAYAVLVLEHLEDHTAFFAETARIVRPSGVLAVVMNHPIWTAPESTPVQDEDGEVLWRPGDYFSPGFTDVEVDGGTVTFHHRSMAEFLNAAADGGWSLERMIERPHQALEDQGGIPRLLACRWRLLP